MKLATRDAASYCARPDPHSAGLLIYGSDAMRVALRRQEVIAALLGPNGEDEMRLSRMSGADLRKDAALLLDAVKAQGFFPGARVAFVEEASDGLAQTVQNALESWQPGDATIIVTSGALTARSALRKLFESHGTARALGIYDDPPGRAEIEAMLKTAGAPELSRETMGDLEALSRALDPGDLRQTIEKLALYKLGDTSPAAPEDLAAVMPQSVEADLDEILHIVAEAQTDRIAPVLARLKAQGVGPVSLCIGANRHFRALHRAASHPNGASAGVAAARPPIFGPRRDRMIRQASRWGLHKLEQALGLLIEADLTLRSRSEAPQMAVMERAFVRLSMLARG